MLKDQVLALEASTQNRITTNKKLVANTVKGKRESFEAQLKAETDLKDVSLELSKKKEHIKQL